VLQTANIGVSLCDLKFFAPMSENECLEMVDLV
jgi:hypothetical protein